MKFSFSLKNKEANVEADIEGIVQKKLENKMQYPNRKTRYQIKQEEKRKNEKLRHAQQMQYLGMLLGLCVLFFMFSVVASFLGI